MVRGFLGTLTVEERVMLHLHEHPLKASEYEADPALTQSGISETVHVARKHLPRTLQKLLAREAIEEHMRHVPGARQRRRVYALTAEGRQEAGSLHRSLLPLQLHGPNGDVPLSSVLAEHELLLDLLDHIDDMMHYDPTTRQNASEADEASAPASATTGGADGADSYRALARTAWQDGVITEDERAMLKTATLAFDLDPEVAQRIEEEVRAERASADTVDKTRIFLEMLETVIGEERGGLDLSDARLSALQRTLRLDDATAQRLLDQWQGDDDEDGILDERLQGYASALLEAWKDGVVTEDEEAILSSLRRSFSISDSEHARVLDVVARQRTE